MPLYLTWTSKGTIIVNATTPNEAKEIALSYAPATGTGTRATQAHLAAFPLLGPALQGDMRPAIQSDPAFVASFGFTIPASTTGGGATKPQAAPPAAPPPTGGGVLPGFTPGQVDEAIRGLGGGAATGPGTAGFIPAGGTSNPLLPGGAGRADDQTGPTGGPLGLDGDPLPSLSDLLAPGDLFDALFRRGLAGRFGTTPSGVGSSIPGRAALQRQPEFENVFGFQRGLAGFQDLGGARDQAFEDFVRNTTGSGLGQEALNAFRTISGLQPGGVPGATEEFRSQFAGANEDQAAQLARLTGSALSAGVSPLALNLLRFPSGGDLRSQFIAETGGGPEADFIEFLRQNFPLASTIR